MLIVEDGTGIADADSYISLVDARVIATNYGWKLPVDDIDADIALRNGALYVDQSESNLQGTRTHDTQALAWPRTGVECRGIAIGDDVIPLDIKKAQVRAAMTAGEGEVNPDYDGKQVASEAVSGAVSISYFEGFTDGSVTITQADNLIKCFTLSAAGGLGINQFRVYRG